MCKRIITAFVLISLAWSSVPYAAAWDMAGHGIHAVSQRNAHSCCPHAQRSVVSDRLVAMDGPAIPCGEQHPCCAKRGQEPVAALPAMNQSSLATPDRDRLRNDAAGSGSSERVCKRGFENSSSYYLSRSAVLRI